MNKDAIRKTAVARFDESDKLFIVESPLLDICSGIAETEAEAWEIFDDLLESMYVKYLEGKAVGQYAQRGRPPKNRKSLGVQVRPQTADHIKALAGHLNISQGEAIDYLYVFWEAAQRVASRKSLFKGLRDSMNSKSKPFFESTRQRAGSKAKAKGKHQPTR